MSKTIFNSHTGEMMGKRDSLFDKLVKMAKKGNELAFLLNEDNPYDVKNWTSTGCFILNAVLSDGDIFKGIPDGKRIMISGKSSTAKSLFTSFMIGSYMRRHENSYAVFFETEGATVTSMARTVGIPEDRIIIIPVKTVEECRHQMLQMLDQIIDTRKANDEAVQKAVAAVKKKNKKATKEEIDAVVAKVQDGQIGVGDKFIFCIDSIGMLSTTKETTDIAASSDGPKDMTRAALLKGFARVTSLKLSIAQIPLLVVNHTYATFDQYNPEAAAGGSGPAYMSDVHLMLFKSKEKDGKVQVGVKIRAHVVKSRFMIENKNVHILLHFKRGLYRMSNLVEMAEELGVFTKEKLSYVFPDGSKNSMQLVRKHPSKYLTPDVLKAIGDAIKEEYSFGELDERIDIEDQLEDLDDDLNKGIDGDDIEFDGGDDEGIAEEATANTD